MRLVADAQNILKLTCYCFDMPEGAAVMSYLLRNGRSIKLLLDANQMKNPSCARQLNTVQELFETAGSNLLEVKSFSPKAGFSALHAKTWCIDGQVYIGGSFNFTKNADLSNEEHLVVVRDPPLVDKHERWFDDLWNKAGHVTKEFVAAGLQRKAEKAETRSRSASESRERSVSVARAPRAPKIQSSSDDLLALPAVPESPRGA